MLLIPITEMSLHKQPLFVPVYTTISDFILIVRYAALRNSKIRTMAAMETTEQVMMQQVSCRITACVAYRIKTELSGAHKRTSTSTLGWHC